MKKGLGMKQQQLEDNRQAAKEALETQVVLKKRSYKRDPNALREDRLSFYTGFPLLAIEYACALFRVDLGGSNLFQSKKVMLKLSVQSFSMACQCVMNSNPEDMWQYLLCRMAKH